MQHYPSRSPLRVHHGCQDTSGMTSSSHSLLRQNFLGLNKSYRKLPLPGDFIHHVYATGMCVENSLGRVQRLRVPLWGVEWAYLCDG